MAFGSFGDLSDIFGSDSGDMWDASSYDLGFFDEGGGGGVWDVGNYDFGYGDDFGFSDVDFGEFGSGTVGDTGEEGGFWSGVGSAIGGALTPKLIGAASNALFSGLGAYTNYGAAQEAEDIGKYNAALEQAQTSREVSVLKRQQGQDIGMARAKAAASGVSGATEDIYLSAMGKSSEEELAWLKTVGASKYDQALAQGRIASSKAMSGFWGDVGSVGQSIASLF